MKADPSTQLLLLDLQQVDTRLQQIAHARSRIPEVAELAQAQQRLSELRDDILRAEVRVGDVQRELDRAEADVQLVRDRAARDQARLDSGQGSAKDLTAIQHELGTLAKRQADLEEVEIEVMERAEEVQARHTELAEREGDLVAHVERLTADLDQASAELDAQEAEARAPREEITGQIDDALLALYDRVRASSGGLGAAPLRARRCGGCQLELNSVELGRLAAAPEDEVLRCEECNRILVRTDESGLPA